MEANLDKEISACKKYDLAVSLEVAEHIPETSAEVFIETLTKASDIIPPKLFIICFFIFGQLMILT
jgi:hypothetical protein